MTDSVKALSDEVKEVKSSAVDANSVMKALAEKTDLANRLMPFVGAFDHADMDKSGVAKYGCEKLGIACDSGAEFATINGYLAAQKQPSFTVDKGNAQDKADDKLLADMGL